MNEFEIRYKLVPVHPNVKIKPLDEQFINSCQKCTLQEKELVVIYNNFTWEEFLYRIS